MTNQEILNFENKRNINNLNIIYLIKDNNGWYKAHEWSAYLLEFYPNSLSDKLLKATKTKIGDNEIIYVSLLLSSLEKYAKDALCSKNTDDIVIVLVDLLAYKNNNINIDNYKLIITDWKNTVELKEKKKQDASSQWNSYQKVFKSSEIESKILGFLFYNLEKEDLILFIIQLKNMCATRI